MKNGYWNYFNFIRSNECIQHTGASSDVPAEK